MMQYLKVILLSFIAIGGESAVDLQCTEVCLQDEAQYSCTIEDIPGIILRWSVPNINNLEGDPHVLEIAKVQQNQSDPTNTFTAVLTDTSNNDQLNSTLSFITTNQLNNNQIKCRAGSNSNTERTCSIMILGTPSVPLNTSVVAIGPNTVVVSWSPPLHSSQCIDHYVVSIVNGNTISNKNTSNSSTTLVINQLIQGMNYSLSVTGVDRAGRTGEESETAKIIMDVPELVIDLNFTLSDESLNLITVTITWKAPSVTLRPPVIDYHVYHNITSFDGSLVHNVTNNMTHITFTSVSRGSQYIVNVTAENIIGIGEKSLIHVYIPISSISSSSLLLSSTIPDPTAIDVSLHPINTIFSTTLPNIQNSYATSRTTNQTTTSVMVMASVSSSSIPEEGTTGSPKSTSPLVPSVASVCGIMLVLLAVLVCVVVFIVYKRQSGKYKSTASNKQSSNKLDRNLEKKRKTNPVFVNIQLQSLGESPIYDIPEWNKKQDIDEIQVETNKAYAQTNQVTRMMRQ